jgi:hypothetical protein
MPWVSIANVIVSFKLRGIAPNSDYCAPINQQPFSFEEMIILDTEYCVDSDKALSFLSDAHFIVV